MDIHQWTWYVTIAVLLALLSVDLLIIARRPHEPSLREATIWVSFYVGLAILFGVGVLVVSGPRYGGEFFAGWLTEYSLSIDNLFVFVIIMARFSVPREYQQTVLLWGIIFALVMRGIFIALGAAVIARFSWVFYIFGAFLVYTAVQLVRHHNQEDEYEENAVLRFVERRLPATTEYHGAKLLTHVDGRRVVTPMLIVMIAIGTTDLLFALDSIPAIFGLTQEPYLVFTANAFALMGLRQLYFLIGGLLDRLVYLSYGLAFVLGFIGVKLVLEALHTNSLPFLNGGEPYEWAPEVPIWLSLGVILVTLAVTTIASLARTRQERIVAERAGVPVATVEAEGREDVVEGAGLSHLEESLVPGAPEDGGTASRRGADAEPGTAAPPASAGRPERPQEPGSRAGDGRSDDPA